MTSRAGYWIGGALIALGVVGAVLWGVMSLRQIIATIDDFQHVPVPGSATVRLEARKYVVYLEGPRADEIAPPVEIVVADARTKSPVVIEDYGGSLTYSFDTTGMAHATVTPPRPGTYEVRTTGLQEGGGYRLAIGGSVGGSIVGGLLGAFAIGGVLGLAGIGMLVATGVRRSRRPAASAAIVPDP